MEQGHGGLVADKAELAAAPVQVWAWGAGWLAEDSGCAAEGEVAASALLASGLPGNACARSVEKKHHTREVSRAYSKSAPNAERQW